MYGNGQKKLCYLITKFLEEATTTLALPTILVTFVTTVLQTILAAASASAQQYICRTECCKN